MRFEIKFQNEVVGFSELEGGDAAMGVAFGRFFPTPAYSSIQAECIKQRNQGALVPELTVSWEGTSIQCSGGIQLIDLSPELGEAGMQIFLNGVINPPYNEIFTQHVAAYRKPSL